MIDKIKEIKYNRLTKEEKQKIINLKNLSISEFIKDCKYVERKPKKYYFCEGGKWTFPQTKEINYEYNNFTFGNNIRLGGLVDPNNLYFNTNWEWLIPIVEKIESLDLKDNHYKWKNGEETYYNFQCISVDISRNTCWIGIELNLDQPITINKKSASKHFKTKIEAVWTAVVEFIEWYNKNKY